MWATSIPASGKIHPTYETFIWEWKDFTRQKHTTIKTVEKRYIFIFGFAGLLPLEI